MSATSWTLLGYTWDLKFTPRSIAALQQSGRFEEFAARVTTESLGAGLEADMQVLLVRAAQQAQHHKCGVGFIRRKLELLPAQYRQLLVTWAAAKFCEATISLLEPAIRASTPVEDDTV